MKHPSRNLLTLVWWSWVFPHLLVWEMLFLFHFWKTALVGMAFLVVRSLLPTLWVCRLFFFWPVESANRIMGTCYLWLHNFLLIPPWFHLFGLSLLLLWCWCWWRWQQWWWWFWFQVFGSWLHLRKDLFWCNLLWNLFSSCFWISISLSHWVSFQPGMEVHACYPSNQKAKARAPWAWNQTGLCREF